ncbi:MAG TPA: hypothetical protein PKH79_10465 [Prolixibacteraceae bacterium]|nr:hypothetical protein [Prolixibacteraceae bacterium]
MRKKNLFYLFLLMLVPSIGFPQGMKLAYNSSILYPGAKAGYEVAYKSLNFEKTKKSGKTRIFTRENLLSANVGYYHHRGYHDNIYLTAGWTKRKIRSNGFFTEFSPEIGISRTFLGGTTYQFDETGQFSVKKSSGYFYPLLSVGGGIGYDFSVKQKDKPFKLYSKLNLLAMYPYNNSVYLRPTFELGIIYQLKNTKKQ